MINLAKRFGAWLGGSWSGYESSNNNSGKRARNPIGAPRDQKTDLNGSAREEIVKNSRYVARNSGMMNEAIMLMNAYACGPRGIIAQSMCPDLGAREEYDAYWERFSRHCEATGRFDMASLQHLISRAVDVDGEAFLIKQVDKFGNPVVSVLESHQVSNITDPKKRIYDGVEIDAAGRPTWYHLRTGEPDAFGRDKTRRIRARNVLHVFEPTNVSAVRGLPALQAGANHLRDVMELLSSETAAIKSNSKLGVVVTSQRDTALEDGDFGIDFDAEVAAGTTGASSQQIADALDARTIRLDPGESAESFQSNRPNSMFQGHLDHLERNASGGHVPWEVAMDPSSAGGAAIRLITSKADRRFQLRQSILINRALVGMWNFVIGYGIDEGEIPSAIGWPRVHWQTPKKITVDSGRDEQADRLALETGVQSFSHYMGERGTNFDQWLEMRTTESRKIMTAAGHPEDEPIPTWMLYKPSGAGFNIQTTTEDES